MASFNRVMLLGNLTRDPQLKFLPSNTAVAEFGLAMNRKFTTGQGEERDEACFVDCAAFGRQAEVINQYCQKGKQVFIEGRLKLDTWEDKQGGGKRSKLTVVVENFTLLGGKRDSGDDSEDAPAQAPAPRPAPQPRQTQPAAPGYSGPPQGTYAANRAARAAGQPAPAVVEPLPFDDGAGFTEPDMPF